MLINEIGNSGAPSGYLGNYELDAGNLKYVAHITVSSRFIGYDK